MAASTSAAASTSTAADSNNSTRYDVFISHRGPDVKKTFASHLYRRLISHGLRVFLDYKELQEGEDFPCQIKGAISAASVHVAIFSPTYADSEWCLVELVLMLESGKTIIPVFHHVEPTELRRIHGGGVYATSLRNLENKTNPGNQLRYDSETIGNWRNALSRVADISGLDLAAFNGDEGALVDKIVEVVVRKGVKTPLNVARYPTGLKEKVQDFEKEVLFNQRSGTVQAVGITGLGGVGKTTLAIELFNRKSSEYSKSYFLSDVRENAKKSLHSLQSQLLKGLFQLELHIDNSHAGIEELKNRLSSCKVLLVLDDIDHQDQVFALLPQLNDLHHDSLILITSRDKDVLRRSGVQESSIYLLSGLNTERSRELFCSHAFCNPHPLPGFENLVDNFLKACNGLPLSLKVFGGLLGGQTDKSYWESKLKALRNKLQLPGDIRNSLQISYDALEEEEKQIFLDIACFFIGIDRDAAIIVWDGSGWDGKLGFQSLMDKCLVELYMQDNYEKGVNKLQHLIRMHDHLRDMGRDLANRAGFPCRIWGGTKHMENLLQQSSSEATRVRGIRMFPGEHYDERSDTDEDGSDTDEDDERASFSRYKMKNLQILDIDDIDDDLLKLKCLLVDSPNLLYLRWSNWRYSSLPPYIPMKKLRVLDVEGYGLETLWKEDVQAPLQLQELGIRNFGNLSRLEHINLSECYALERLPDSFGNLSRLEHINLSECSALERLPDSFGNLSRLKYINLSECCALKRLPDSFGNLLGLEYINLFECSALKRLPDSFGNLSRLEYINLSDCRALERLPDSFGNLSGLEYINLSECHALQRLPDSFGNLSRLEYINLLQCRDLETLPDSFGNLSRLEHINLTYCSALKRLPDSFGNLSRLEHSNLSLSYCRDLERLPDSFGNLSRLEHINLSECRALERLPDSFGNLSRLEHINLSQCWALERLPDFFGNLIKLEYLDLRGCDKLTIPGGTFREINAQYMYFPGWRIEVFPPQIAHQWSLQKLLLCLINLTEWPSATGEACHLERLVLETPFLEALPPSFGNDLRNLKCLELQSCRSLKRLPDSFLLLNQLVDLRVEDCSPELDFKAVEGENETSTDSGGERTSSNLERFLPRLQHLTLRRTHISEVSFPTCVFPDLQCLDISECPDLVEVTLPNALRSLYLHKCSKLRKIGAPFPTGACANLQDLHIMKCNDLMPNASFKDLACDLMPNTLFYNALFEDPACVMTSRHGLAIKVEISNLSKLRKIRGPFPTGVYPNFQDLSIQHCENLVELEILPTAIQHLKISKCDNLVELEILPTVIQHPKIRKCEELEVSRRKEVEKPPSIECNTETLRESRGQRALSNSDSLFDKCLLRLQHLELDNLQISQVSLLTGVCPNLQHLHISDCEDLIEVRTLPNALIKLQLDRCPKLRLIRIEELAQVMQLREMRVGCCDGLEEMVGVGYLKSLEVMQVIRCTKLKIIQGLEQLTQLRELDFSYCFELEELLGVGHLKSLEVFKATMCQRLKRIRGLEQLTLLRLRKLDVSYCSELETLS